MDRRSHGQAHGQACGKCTPAGSWTDSHGHAHTGMLSAMLSRPCSYGQTHRQVPTDRFLRADSRGQILVDSLSLSLSLADVLSQADSLGHTLSLAGALSQADSLEHTLSLAGALSRAGSLAHTLSLSGRLFLSDTALREDKLSGTYSLSQADSFRQALWGRLFQAGSRAGSHGQVLGQALSVGSSPRSGLKVRNFF
jgi:hypothetical protein